MIRFYCVVFNYTVLCLVICYLLPRLVKEKVMYVKETRQQEEKIERLKAEACDEEADSEAKYVIKKQVGDNSAE